MTRHGRRSMEVKYGCFGAQYKYKRTFCLRPRKPLKKRPISGWCRYTSYGSSAHIRRWF
ncbi:hypothetical protein AGR2A_pc0129 [Agrobacterium genomosp. 2 str. CFBP 5494]|uniref:Uncharacterized protein n=1 Tax=Agrobacterium genomosp. 2 str. CFBP 5494 TaxID=1183436 RepID=A0A9W5F6L9_9HYPH|nr:hypothetical protein AGR2A_pc0129 [Agrobacterium genomosp. 2 str. CFBP 5494]